MEYGMHWNTTAFWDSLGEVPITNINRALACQALNMLALCYLPGCIAGYIQLYRGTKYSRFPKILDRWLKMRKYLGLLMLFSACIHVRHFLLLSKGQLISKCPLGVIVLTKIPTKIF